MNKTEIKKLDTTEKLLKLFPMMEILKTDEQNFQSILYVSSLILVLEKTLTFIIAGGIKSGITKELRDPEIIEFAIGELTLNSKIKILEQVIRENKKLGNRYKKLIAYLKEINAIRNQIFHSKLKNLRYKSCFIADIKTQHNMLLDYLNAAKEATGRTTEE
ncbi:MAG: hypothetical protein HYT27_01835 [Parcubacteria group bacterium]|nr:hypothetical protein [Parcubacteria group bacterium]